MTLVCILVALAAGATGTSSGSAARSREIAPGVQPVGLITSIYATFDGKATGSETNAAPVNGQQDLEQHTIDEQWHVTWKAPPRFDHPGFRSPAASSGLIGLVGDDSAASGSGYAVTPGIVVGGEYKTCQAPLTFDPAELDGVSKLSIQLTADGAKPGLFTHQGTASFLVPIFASTLVGSPCNGTTPRFSAPNAEVDIPIDLDAIAQAGQMSFPLEGTVMSTGGATGATSWSGTLTIYVKEGGYTALGDSYSSGEGAGEYDEDSNTSKDRCHRSALAWPELVAQKLRLAQGLSFWACSGARIDNIMRTAGRPEEGASFKIEPPQISHVLGSDGLITLSIGGNDLGVGSAVPFCLTHHPCAGHAWNTWVHRGFGYVRLRLRPVLDAIRAAAPDAQIVLVGYPNFLPYEGRICRQGPFAFAPTDVLWIHNQISQLNHELEMITKQVEDDTSKPVRWVDPSAAFIGHDVCHKATSWFNGVTLRGLVLGHKVEFFHPTAQGQAAIAQAVFEELRPSE